MTSTEKPQKPKMREPVWYRPPGVAETGLAFVGHQISEDEQYFVQLLHYDQLYSIRHGQNSKTFLKFLEGKLYGTECPKCGDRFFPPRINCWNLDCNLERTNWIELPLRGRVHTYTVAGWSGRSSLQRLPIVLAYVIIEGCATAVANELRGLDPWDAEFNMPVKVVFRPRSERVGAITDFHFEPAGDWKPSPTNPEKERIKELLGPVYEWVATLKKH